MEFKFEITIRRFFRLRRNSMISLIQSPFSQLNFKQALPQRGVRHSKSRDYVGKPWNP